MTDAVVAEAEHPTGIHSPQAARDLLNAVRPLEINWRGQAVLDFGCRTGDLAAALRRHAGAASVDGVDDQAYWRTPEQGSGADGVALFAGDLLTLPELQDKTYDIVVSIGMLMTLEPVRLEQVLAWLIDHLKPGGFALLDTDTFFANTGSGAAKRLDVPYPHLLFSGRVLNQYMAAHGKPPPRPMLPYAASTWLMLFKAAGFELLEVERQITNMEAALGSHAVRIEPYDPLEVATPRITVLARKPIEALNVAKEVL